MYENAKCAYCGEQFAKNDDIVVCPDCGTPYHRHCWQEHGKCAHADEHAAGYVYQKSATGAVSETSPEEDFVQKMKEQILQENPKDDKTHCENCGAELLEQNDYCVYCGHKKGQAFSGTKKKFAGRSPLGGIPADAFIGGAEVKDLALLVRRNSDKLLPKLQKVSQRKVKIGWSWLAFFFGYLYLFFRKLYKYGLIVIAVQILLFNVLNVAMGDPVTKVNDTVAQYYSSQITSDNPTDEEYTAAVEGAAKELIENGTLARLYALLGISLLVSNVACALLFHYLYLRHCTDTIRRMKKSAEILGDMTDADYRLNLMARGGISIFGLVLGYMSYFMLGQIVSYIIEMFTK